MAPNAMADRLERFLQRHGPGGAAHARQAELNERGYVLLGSALVACLDDARAAGAGAQAEALLREHMTGWEENVKHAREWFSLWKLEQGTDESK